MPTRRFELAQLLVSGCAVVFGLIELAQAQPGYVPPPTPLPPPVLNPSNPGTVPQPSYRPITPTTPSTVPSVDVTPPAARSEQSSEMRTPKPQVNDLPFAASGTEIEKVWPFFL